MSKDFVQEKPIENNGSELSIKTIYRPEDIKDTAYDKDLGDGGEYPFTRGLHAQGYRNYSWVQRNVCGFDLPEDTNERIKYLMKVGQRGYEGQYAANIAFDLPSQIGIDCDHLMSKYEVGKCGVTCANLQDMRLLFDGLPLANTNAGLVVHGGAPVTLAMYIANAEEQGVSRSKLIGQVPNNPFCFIGGTYMTFPPEMHLRMMVDTIKFCHEYMPRWNAINLGGYVTSETGANAVQEIAFPISIGINLIKEALKLNLNIDQIAPKISNFLGLKSDFFENIAKIRAARRIWAKLMREWFGAKKDKTCHLRLLVWTSGNSMTVQEPLNNIARVAIEALSGVLGGAQAVHTVGYDETYRLPTEDAVRIAMKTQKILEHESGVCNVVDPLGGSYYMESLTNDIETACWGYINKIEEMGGFIKAFEKGYLQKEVANSAYQYQREIDSKERIIVGVNDYVEEEATTEPFPYNPKTEKHAIERIEKWKKERDKNKLYESLARVKEAASDDNSELIPYFIETVKAGATLGEVMDTLKEVFGSYQTTNVLAAPAPEC